VWFCRSKNYVAFYCFQISASSSSLKIILVCEVLEKRNNFPVYFRSLCSDLPWCMKYCCVTLLVLVLHNFVVANLPIRS